MALVRNGHKLNTQRTYNSAQKQYLEFCKIYGYAPILASEELLLMYLAYLQRKSLKYASVNVYFAAVRCPHVLEGHGNPLEGALRLKQAFKAVRLNSGPQKQKLPITFELLSKLKYKLSDSYNNKLLWAAMTMAYFGLLRASEFCTDKLCINNIAIIADSHMSVLLKERPTSLVMG